MQQKSEPYILTNCDLFIDDSFLQEGKKYELKFKDLPNEDKPREKLLKYGPTTLSVAELTAIILGTGSKKEDVMHMARRIVKEYGERTFVKNMNPDALAKELNIPIGKAMQVVAVAEIGKRFFDKSDQGPVSIRTARDVFEYTVDMRKLPKEHLRGLYLNTHHRVIHDEVISIGTIDSNLVHPREVFKPAIEYGAAAVVLVHNHPSGIVTPSEADIAITKQIAAAGRLIGVPLIDHVIVGTDGFASITIDY